MENKIDSPLTAEQMPEPDYYSLTVDSRSEQERFVSDDLDEMIDAAEKVAEDDHFVKVAAVYGKEMRLVFAHVPDDHHSDVAAGDFSDKYRQPDEDT